MAAVIESFDTTRLRSERLRPSHFDDLQRMHSDARVMATLGGVREEAQTHALIRANEEHWQRYGYGLWIFRDSATGAFAGRGGLRHLEVGGGSEIEVAYALRAEFWNRGLATEMAVAIVRIAFEELRIDNLVCFTQPTNYASRRVMEKAGFRYERDIVHARLPHVFCRLERGSWRSATGKLGERPRTRSEE
jgi:ribosomal-protein-alanine N-acetyltransferase